MNNPLNLAFAASAGLGTDHLGVIDYFCHIKGRLETHAW
jgi:hypothetical protein